MFKLFDKVKFINTDYLDNQKGTVIYCNHGSSCVLLDKIYNNQICIDNIANHYLESLNTQNIILYSLYIN